MPTILGEDQLRALAVPLREGETYQDRDRIDELLAEHWKGKSAWSRDESEQDRKQFTYGEVTPIGVRQLIHILGLQQLVDDDKQSPMDPTVFYDLGSGAGKLVVQMFLEKVTSISVGVELSKRRHDLAVKSWTSLQEAAGLSRDDVVCKIRNKDGQLVEQDRVILLNKDMVKTDFSDATHIYLSSLCFPRALADRAALRMMDNYQRHGKLKVILSLTDLKPFETDEMQALWTKSYELIHMTWGFSTVRVYKYKFASDHGKE